MSNNTSIIDAVRSALSASRMSTYEAATQMNSHGDSSALQLYAWNAEVSGALLAPLHICEVVIRNTVADALTMVYGDKWPWTQTFERSLPDPQHGYSPRRDLQSVRKKGDTAGKVIPELSFVFWQKMFTSRYDNRIWEPYLRDVLPNISDNKPVSQLREDIYKKLERVRQLRNRIAHHEPIFTRSLDEDYQIILQLIEYRCEITAEWLNQNQRATVLITAKPLGS